MIDGSEERKRQFAFELQNSPVFEKRSNSPLDEHISVLHMRLDSKMSVLGRIDSRRLDKYRKIPKISPGAYIFQRPFLRGLSTKGNLGFKIDWASLIVVTNFTGFALFYFIFEGNFPSTSPQGLIFEGAI